MDFGALETDLVSALKKLPQEFLTVVATLILTHKDALFATIPALFETLKPHIGAGMMEGSMGILDQNELERTAMRALSQFVKLPDVSVTQKVPVQP
jgi:hypothetical protein